MRKDEGRWAEPQSFPFLWERIFTTCSLAPRLALSVYELYFKLKLFPENSMIGWSEVPLMQSMFSNSCSLLGLIVYCNSCLPIRKENTLFSTLFLNEGMVVAILTFSYQKEIVVLFFCLRCIHSHWYRSKIAEDTLPIPTKLWFLYRKLFQIHLLTAIALTLMRTRWDQSQQELLTYRCSHPLARNRLW